MARFRLRYQSTDLEMQIGDFVVGRSSSCHLALDDGLVSRRHAVFYVDPAGVEVEDLGSRNGVQVNGDTIEGRTRLKHLDRVVIGSQELLVVRVQQDEHIPHRGDRATLAGMTLELPIIDPRELPDEPTMYRTGSVVDRIADKAMALGRFEEAERMLGRRLSQILNETRNGQKLADDKLAAASQYALRLAAGTGKASWIDYVFSIHDATGKVVDAECIGKLHDLFRQLRYPGGTQFREYLANLREQAEHLAPNERFVLQRLEGLERMVGA